MSSTDCLEDTKDATVGSNKSYLESDGSVDISLSSSDPLLGLRKGLFGKSASYLQDESNLECLNTDSITNSSRCEEEKDEDLQTKQRDAAKFHLEDSLERKSDLTRKVAKDKTDIDVVESVQHQKHDDAILELIEGKSVVGDGSVEQEQIKPSSSDKSDASQKLEKEDYPGLLANEAIDPEIDTKLMENKEENSDKINKKLLDNRERNISPIGKKEESEGEIGTSKMDVECVVTTVKEESMETNDEYGKKGGTRDDILPELDKDQEINYDINISFNECKNENEHETITKNVIFGKNDGKNEDEKSEIQRSLQPPENKEYNRKKIELENEVKEHTLEDEEIKKNMETDEKVKGSIIKIEKSEDIGSSNVKTRSARKNQSKASLEENDAIKAHDNQMEFLMEDLAAERRRSLRTPRITSYCAESINLKTPQKSIKTKISKESLTTSRILRSVTRDSKITPTSSATKNRISKEKETEGRGTRSSKKISEKREQLSSTEKFSETLAKKSSVDKSIITPGKSQNKKELKGLKVNRTNDSEKDPFSFESNFNNHPEPLRHIQMERRSFGTCKFTKTPSGSANKYEKTEQTASERRSNLTSLIPQSKAVYRRSLTELFTSTPSLRQEITVSKSRKKSIDSGDVLFVGTGDIHAIDTDEEIKSVGGEEEGDMEIIPRKAIKRSHSRSHVVEQYEAQNKKRKSISQTTFAYGSKPNIPELTAEEQFSVDHPLNEHVPFRIGARVYALWDRMYYPARVSAERDSSGRYEVLFVEDNEVRRLVSTGIISLCNLVSGKKCLTTVCKDGDEILEEVEIVESPPSNDIELWTKAMFVVKSDENNKRQSVPWQKLILDAAQAKGVQKLFVNTTREVIADNIDSTEGRRSRSTRHSSNWHEASPFVNAKKSASEAKRPMKKEIRKNEFVEITREPSPKQRSTRQYMEIQQSCQSDQHHTEARDHIFDGIFFVVTSAMRKNKDDDQGFSKREVRQLIEARGGVVVDDFSKISPNKKMLLIADTYYRTHKYLSALARAVPCISHLWVSECVEKNKLVDYSPYMLPAGLSLLTSETTPWHSRNMTLLKGKKVYIFSESSFGDPAMPNFTKIWSPLIAQMGATIVPDIFAEPIDILLTDPTCTEMILEAACRYKAEIVSSEWIIQSIIHGSLPPVSSHERFRYDFVEKTDS